MPLSFCTDPHHLIQDRAFSTTVLITSTLPIATETTSSMVGIVSALTRVLSTLSTTASAHHVHSRIKTVHRLCDLDLNMPTLTFPAIFGNIAQACANRGNPITAAPAEATFSATSGGTLFASGWGSEYGDCTSDGSRGIGRGGIGKGRCNGWAGRCSWTTFTGNWGPSWLVSWSGFHGGDDDCSTTTDSSLTAATSPSRVSATITASPSPSLGATVTTTVNGQTLTGTIFSAQAATTGTAAVAQQTGQASRYQPFGALGAMVFWLGAAICML